MKLTAIFLTALCLQVSAGGNAQGISLSEKNVSLDKIFASIKKQAGYSFLYTKEMLQDTKKVTVQIKNASIEQVLNECLKDQPVTYTIVNNTVIIKPRETTSPNDEANLRNEPPPPIDITGKVTDENGNPLAGASVKVKGTSNGAITNNDGVFVLKGVDEDATLEISFVGYETYTIAVANKSTIVASLKIKPENLNEIVINKGYYTEKQRNSVGNVTHIDAKEIEKQPVQNPLLALQGRVPGLEVTQLTGLPGGGVKVRIQGQNSLFSGLDPLIVIDGVPFPSQLAGAFVMDGIVQQGSPLNYINPNDIESIDILKDADATAIYGSRAANGAILITTKKGKSGRTKLSINLQQGWGKVTRKVDMMNTRQYLDMRYEAFKNDGIDITTLTPDGSNYDLTLWDTTRYTDWQKELIGGTAKYTNVNVGMSGGTTNLQYLVGATYNRQTTVFPGDFDNKMGGLHFNINGFSSNQKLRMQLTGSYSNNQNHLPGYDLTRQAILMEPNAPALFNADGTLNWAPDASGSSSWQNPLAYTQNTDFNNTTKNLVSNLNLSYYILPGLEIRSNFGFTNITSDLYTPSRLEWYPPEYRSRVSRRADFGNRNMNSWIIEPQLQYTHQIGKGKVDALLGSTVQKASSNYLYLTGSGFANDLLMKTLKAATSVTINSSASSITRFSGLFGRLGYNWDGKYLINLTARRDGSSKFGPEARFHNFGSVALGWIFSEENWKQRNLSFLSFGKLRGSYGTTGNDQIADFAYLSTYGINNPTIGYQNNIGLTVNNIPNPYLEWEETKKWQGGIDLGFIKDRIFLGVTYAANVSSNQLTQYPLPTLTGFGSMSKNRPTTIQNTSWEFTLNTVNIKSGKFSWSTSANLTIGRNKLIRFPGIENTSYANPYSGIIIGQPLGIQKLTHYVGLDSNNGMPLFLDASGNNTTYDGVRNVLFSALTKYYGGIVNTISYKGFQLDFLIQFVRKKGPRDIYWYNGALDPGNFSSSQSNQPITVLNRWQKPGDKGIIPVYTTNYMAFGEILGSSDAWYNYDASYIRLKNLSISWQLPSSLIKKAHIQNAQLYVHGQNLITFTKYSGFDPETLAIDALPSLRMITTGVNIEF